MINSSKENFHNLPELQVIQTNCHKIQEILEPLAKLTQDDFEPILKEIDRFVKMPRYKTMSKLIIIRYDKNAFPYKKETKK